MLTIAMKRKRNAVIVGETTKGGAYGGEFMPISCRFDAFIPYYYSTIGDTQETWEAVGVRPDVPTPAEDAVRVAQKLALEQLIKNSDAATEDSFEQEVRQERLQFISELDKRVPVSL
jgi:C-terminal processing protease CtpA/Prc